MLTLDLANLAVEFKDGAIKHVGASNSRAEAKLYDVSESEARGFGNDRIKVSVADDEGNHVEIALFEDEARSIKADLTRLIDEESVFE